MSIQELEAAARGWYAAVGNLDIDATCDAYAEDGTFFDTVPHRFDDGKTYASFSRWAMESMVSTTASLHQVSCRMLGDDVGVVTAHDFFSAVRKNGSGIRLYGRATMIFSKETGEWKMIHGHFSPVLSPSPV